MNMNAIMRPQTGLKPINDFNFKQPEEGRLQKEESEFALSAEFWQDFVTNYWEKKPTVIKQPFARMLASSEELFGTLIKAADDYRKGDRNSGMMFHLDYASLISNLGKNIPALEDVSSEGYARRIEQQFNGQKFELTANQIHVYDADLWMRLREFVRPMFAHIGMPAKYVKSFVFFKNQESTSIGVHQDEASVFAFLVEGRKRMVTWPAEFFSDRAKIQATFDYQEFLDEATILEGEPGDILYWPSSYWHIGESIDELTLSMSLAFFIKEKPFTNIMTQVYNRVQERLGSSANADLYAFNPGALQESAETLPDAWNLSTDLLREISMGAELEQSLKLSWLNRATGYGFVKVPPPLPIRSLGDDEVVRGDAGYPIVYIPWSDGKMVISTNGHSFMVNTCPQIEKLIRLLNKEEPRQVATLINECAEPSDNTVLLRNVLEKLLSLRAITNHHFKVEQGSFSETRDN